MTVNIRKDEEEEIFKRKLLYDGHGSGEDKRLLSLIRNITKLCFSDESNEDLIRLCVLIQKDMLAATTAAEKHAKISNMYDRTFDNIKQSIDDKKQQLEALKLDMTKLQLDQEFLEKLKKVDVYPDCQATKSAMLDIERKKKRLMESIERHRLSLTILAESCKNLQRLLENVDDSNETTNLKQQQEVESESSQDEMSL